MKFLSVRELRSKSADVWKNLPEEREMVITSNGRPIAILAAVGDADVESALAAFRQARAIESVTWLQRRSLEQGTNLLTNEDINDEISTVRRKRTPA
jgi:antitoxin (DNA-binding transcriptional repressor) of toxin-antitoxin stability system